MQVDKEFRNKVEDKHGSHNVKHREDVLRFTQFRTAPAEAFAAQILPDHFAMIEFDDIAKPEAHPDFEEELENADPTT
jgi:hypothetical protein